MRERGLSAKDVLGLAGLAVVASLASGPGGRDAGADERPKASSAVRVQAQGASGVEPVSGSPPAIAPPLEMRPVQATLAPVPALSGAPASASSLRALSSAEGEATVEIDGVRETVRPGSRLGRDTVRSVSPGRLVLERAAAAKEPGALVIVTFDETGRARERVFWRSDPSVTAAPEVKQP